MAYKPFLPGSDQLFPSLFRGIVASNGRIPGWGGVSGYGVSCMAPDAEQEWASDPPRLTRLNHENDYRRDKNHHRSIPC